MDIIATTDAGWPDCLHRLTAGASQQADEALEHVQRILHDVRHEGDNALVRYTRQFDGHEQIVVDAAAMRDARGRVPGDVAAALERARERISDYHSRQLHNSWFTTGPQGEVLGQLVRPLDRVGVYVPGGKAVYPTSVLMNAIPAMVAGVGQVCMVTPARGGRIDPLILAAADLCGITEVYAIGGAQAIAALAYGTQSVPRVDKIVGPGNIYVATAKKCVYGDVDIDMIAGPSEILIIADGTGDPEWAAADLLSQAEHDELARAVLLTIDRGFAAAAADAVERQLATLPKKEIAAAAIRDNAAIVVVRSLAEAVAISNQIAPEHLELFLDDPWAILPLVKHAGAVFLGHHTPEPVGDYMAGPNHVLPTGGTARFFSPLSVDDFVKKSSLLSFPEPALASMAEDIARLARCEQLEAHARAIDVRMKPR